MKFAVIGAGSGGQCMAAHLTQLGHEAVLYDIDQQKLHALQKRGEILLENKLTGAYRIACITSDIQVAVTRAGFCHGCYHNRRTWGGGRSDGSLYKAGTDCGIASWTLWRGGLLCSCSPEKWVPGASAYCRVSNADLWMPADRDWPHLCDWDQEDRSFGSLSQQRHGADSEKNIAGLSTVSGRCFCFGDFHVDFRLFDARDSHSDEYQPH